jgi:hypothetical protein
MAASDAILILRHLPGNGQTRFQVTRLSDGKTSPPVKVRSPVGFPVAGLPSSVLVFVLAPPLALLCLERWAERRCRGGGPLRPSTIGLVSASPKT